MEAACWLWQDWLAAPVSDRRGGSALRRIVPISIAVVVGLWPAPVFAAIDTPDTFAVVEVEAFRNVLEDDDQLYLVQFSLGYGSPPSETAEEAVLFRLRDDVDAELATVAPFAFVDDGWIDGVVSFYFSAADAPAWQGDFDVQMIGNPSLEWTDGDPWSAINDTITYADNAGQIAGRIRAIGNSLEAAYSLVLIERVAGVEKLTSDGETYFETVIPTLLREAVPELFAASSLNPVFEDRTFTQTYATTVETQLESVPALDATDLETATGVTREWWTALVFIAAALAVMFIIQSKLNDVRTSSFLFGIIMIGGSVTGFMPFMAGVAVAIIGVLAIVWPMFYRPSSA